MLGGRKDDGGRGEKRELWEEKERKKKGGTGRTENMINLESQGGGGDPGQGQSWWDPAKSEVSTRPRFL